MNALENLYSRRSIRSYTGEAVTEAELQKILKAAHAGMKEYEIVAKFCNACAGSSRPQTLF